MSDNESINLKPVWDAINSIEDKPLRYVLTHGWMTALSSLSLGKNVEVQHGFLKHVMDGGEPSPMWTDDE